MIQINQTSLEPKLHTALKALSAELSLEFTNSNDQISFQSSTDYGLKIEKKDSQTIIHYASLSSALRGLSAVLSKSVKTTEAISSFNKFGIMVDCSRNAVMKVESFKKWLRKISLLGYNQVMLYTEDTYKLEGEPYFGYLRGAYSSEEIKELDDYAYSLGIEMVACIQTLGHLAQILKWQYYRDIKDTERVVMVDHEKTYALIEKMIQFWKDNLRSRKIHIGMDEAHDQGRGRYMDHHGYENGFDMFNRHLKKVCEICDAKELDPMIWSDMYFSIGSKENEYYDKDLVIPKEVIPKIPKQAELVYWDYYHKDKEFYLNWIQKHRELNKEPVMASGIWTWSKFWYDHETTVANAGPCIEACKETGIKDIFFTMWGDDGAYCDFNSAFTGMVWCAEKAYSDEIHESEVELKLQTHFSANYNDEKAISSHFSDDFPAQALLWDDPILNIYSKHLYHHEDGRLDKAIERFQSLDNLNIQVNENSEAGNVVHGLNFIRFILNKLNCAKKLITIGQTKDWAALQHTKAGIQQVIRDLEVFSSSFRNNWHCSFKPHGLEVIQIRLAGIKARYEELLMRIDELDSAIGIEELSESIDPKQAAELFPHYINVASSSLVISQPV